MTVYSYLESQVFPVVNCALVVCNHTSVRYVPSEYIIFLGNCERYTLPFSFSHKASFKHAFRFASIGCCLKMNPLSGIFAYCNHKAARYFESRGHDNSGRKEMDDVNVRAYKLMDAAVYF